MGTAVTQTTPVSYAYVARYRYTSDVLENDNLLRLVPYSDDHQTVLDYQIATIPQGGQVSYKDRFGNTIHRVRISTHHRELVIAAVGRVALLPWKLDTDDVPRPSGRYGPEYLEFLSPTRLVEPNRLADFASRFSSATAGLVETVAGVVDWVHKNIEYHRGSTNIQTPAHEVLSLGRGVCQDQTHLAIGILRALGIPCRYVGGMKTGRVGETHAWFEFLHTTAGWVPGDCTENVVGNVGTRLLKLSVGRDYADTTPVSGTFLSMGAGSLDTVSTRARLDNTGYSVEEAIKQSLKD